MNPKESEVLKENVRFKLEKTNTKYKVTADKKRWEKLFEKRRYSDGVLEDIMNLNWSMQQVEVNMDHSRL